MEYELKVIRFANDIVRVEVYGEEGNMLLDMTLDQARRLADALVTAADYIDGGGTASQLGDAK